MAALVALKLLTVVVSYASGNAGGLFAPTLFIGAMMGGAVGSVAHLLLPNQTATAGAYALVGMGAAFAGIIRTPMTSVIMIFEVTHNYTIIVPLMIANLMSFYISRKGQPETMYEALALQDGIHLPGGRARAIVGNFHVSDVMRAPGEVFGGEDPVAHVLEVVRQSRFSAWVVVNQRGILGLISRGDLERATANGAEEKRVEEIISARPVPHVHEDQLLDLALQRLGEAGSEMIPVVSRADVRELVGVVRLADILAKYGIPPQST
jgi:CIC family chloride channel protein